MQVKSIILIYIIFKNMSKKAQPQAKQNQKNKAQIVDQQNQPFLRSLQKKVRNINKKLADIAQLQQKENLKAQQIEKINRKTTLLQERAKIEQTAALYKQSYAENAEHFRNNQLKELDLLARALAVSQTQSKFPDFAKVQKLWNGIHSIEGNNLNEVISNISTFLREAANDYKLQRSLNTFITQNGQKALQKQEQSPVQSKVEVHTDEVIIIRQDYLNEKGQVQEIQITEKIHDGVIQEITVEVINEEQPSSITPPPTPAPTQPTEASEAPKKEQPANNENKQDRPYRGKNNYRGGDNRGEYRGERRGGEDNRRRYNDGGERKAYKPKYEQKEEVRDNRGREAKADRSSSSSDQETKQFKLDEIKRLQEQGFTVVGKPKPKAQEQRDVHDRQHGRKHQHHNKPLNQN